MSCVTRNLFCLRCNKGSGSIILKLKCQGEPCCEEVKLVQVGCWLRVIEKREEEMRGDGFYSGKRTKRKRRWFG